MAENVSQGGIWLGVYFARPDLTDEEKWFIEDIKKFESCLPNRSDINFIKASHDDFCEEVLRADVVFLGGGDSHLLFNKLNTYDNIQDVLSYKNKTYAGSSAGMDVLGRDFFESPIGLGKGFNMIPYGMVVHYQSTDYLHNQNGEGHHPPRLLLHETQFITFEI